MEGLTASDQGLTTNYMQCGVNGMPSPLCRYAFDNPLPYCSEPEVEERCPSQTLLKVGMC